MPVEAQDRWMDSEDLLSYLESPRDRIFYEIVWRQLAGHMAPDSQSILDVGCGQGYTAVRMCQQGHAVTAVDPDADHLAAALRLAQDADQPVRFLQGAVEEILHTVRGARFSWIFLHNVLEAVENPSQAISLCASALEPGGYLSVVARNPNAKLISAILLDKEPIRARHILREMIGASTDYGAEPERAYSFDQVGAWLRASRLHEVARYGVRALYDYVRSEAVKVDPEWHASMRTLEIEAGKHSPFREMGAHIHILAQKRGRER